MKKIIVSRRKVQERIDNLSSALNIIVSDNQSKKSNVALTQSIDYSHITPVRHVELKHSNLLILEAFTHNDVHTWHKLNVYRGKHIRYKQLLKTYVEEYNADVSIYFELASSRRHLHLLQDLVEMADVLSQTYSQELEEKFFRIERQLQSSSFGFLWMPLQIEPSIQPSYTESLYERYIRSFLRGERSSNSFPDKLNLREMFRRIIQFFFKNMDDESDHVNLLPQPVKRFINHINHVRWKKMISYNI